MSSFLFIKLKIIWNIVLLALKNLRLTIISLKSEIVKKSRSRTKQNLVKMKSIIVVILIVSVGSSWSLLYPASSSLGVS